MAKRKKEPPLNYNAEIRRLKDQGPERLYLLWGEEDYLRAWAGPKYDLGSVWQLRYDRFFTRIMDNSKVLAATGMKQENLRKLYDGLAYEVGRCPRDFPFKNNQFMDDYLKEKGIR